MNNYKTARTIKKRFASKEGSQHIATTTAIRGLIGWLKQEKPTSVLEIGAGIGTLTYTVIQTLGQISPNNHCKIICIENNPFCLQQLKTNLAADFDKILIFPTVEQIPSEYKTFDFVILDGGGNQDKSLFSRLSGRAVVFIEGGRLKQAETLETVIKEKSFVKAVIKTSKIKEKFDSHIKWEKGYRVYKLNPDKKHKILFSYLGIRNKFIMRFRKWKFFLANSRFIKIKEISE